MKYIIASINEMEVPVLFPSFVPHSKFKDMNPVSAGHCKSTIINNDWVAYTAFGKSIGLGLNSRTQDSLLITKALNFKNE